MLAFPALNGGKASDWLQPTQQPKWPGADWTEAFQACRAASQSISAASNGGRGSQEAADACSPCRRAIRRRHSAVDEGRGGRVVARHISVQAFMSAQRYTKRNLKNVIVQNSLLYLTIVGHYKTR